jgi:hypothetical protein
LFSGSAIYVGGYSIVASMEGLGLGPSVLEISKTEDSAPGPAVSGLTSVRPSNRRYILAAPSPWL